MDVIRCSLLYTVNIQTLLYVSLFCIRIYYIIKCVCVCVGTMDDHTRGIRLKPLGAMEG